MADISYMYRFKVILGRIMTLDSICSISLKMKLLLLHNLERPIKIEGIIAPESYGS